MSDIGPFEALMLLCSYEERTKETIDPKKLESGEIKLSDLLTEEDFVMARSVSTVLFVCMYQRAIKLTMGMQHDDLNFSFKLRKQTESRRQKLQLRCFWTTLPRKRLHSLKRLRPNTMVCTQIHTRVLLISELSDSVLEFLE